MLSGTVLEIRPSSGLAAEDQPELDLDAGAPVSATESEVNRQAISDDGREITSDMSVERWESTQGDGVDYVKFALAQSDIRRAGCDPEQSRQFLKRCLRKAKDFLSGEPGWLLCILARLSGDERCLGNVTLADEMDTKVSDLSERILQSGRSEDIAFVMQVGHIF